MEANPIRSFELHDKQWLEHLQQHGVVVIRSCLTKEEVQRGISLFWDWMENLNSGLQRGNSDSWLNSAWPGLPDMGFFTSYGGAHSRASWFMRTRPKVKQAFAAIWQTNELISSFDTFIAWRPWWHDSSWKPYVENLHVDQNPARKKGFHCVQGMIPLYKVDEVGGLMVVPDTNNDKTQQELVKRYPFTEGTNSDWLEFRGGDPFMGKGILVKCQAGDLILWDSRTVHGGLILQPSEEFKKVKSKDELVRLAMTVTMVPRSLASQGILERRRKAFKERKALTHWPHEYVVSGMGAMAKDIVPANIKFQEVELTQEIKQLIG